MATTQFDPSYELQVAKGWRLEHAVESLDKTTNNYTLRTNPSTDEINRGIKENTGIIGYQRNETDSKTKVFRLTLRRYTGSGHYHFLIEGNPGNYTVRFDLYPREALSARTRFKRYTATDYLNSLRSDNYLCFGDCSQRHDIAIDITATDPDLTLIYKTNLPVLSYQRTIQPNGQISYRVVNAQHLNAVDTGGMN